MHRGQVGDALVVAAVVAGVFGVVLLAIAGGFGVQLPAWVCAACGVAGGAIGWSLNTPRRP